MVAGVIMTGPLFNGRALVEAEAGCREIGKQIAEDAAVQIREFLPTQYQYDPVPDNAGYYVSQIHAEASAEDYLVTDSQVIYGPWLEGVSERNQATRFKGYGAFQKISQQVDTEAGDKAERILTPYVAAMNGF